MSEDQAYAHARSLDELDFDHATGEVLDP